MIAAESIVGRVASDYDPNNDLAEGSLGYRFLKGFKYGRKGVD